MSTNRFYKEVEKPVLTAKITPQLLVTLFDSYIEYLEQHKKFVEDNLNNKAVLVEYMKSHFESVKDEDADNSELICVLIAQEIQRYKLLSEKAKQPNTQNLLFIQLVLEHEKVLSKDYFKIKAKTCEKVRDGLCAASIKMFFKDQIFIDAVYSCLENHLKQDYQLYKEFVSHECRLETVFNTQKGRTPEFYFEWRKLIDVVNTKMSNLKNQSHYYKKLSQANPNSWLRDEVSSFYEKAPEKKKLKGAYNELDNDIKKLEERLKLKYVFILGIAFVPEQLDKELTGEINTFQSVYPRMKLVIDDLDSLIHLVQNAKEIYEGEQGKAINDRFKDIDTLIKNVSSQLKKARKDYFKLAILAELENSFNNTSEEYNKLKVRWKTWLDDVQRGFDIEKSIQDLTIALAEIEVKTKHIATNIEAEVSQYIADIKRIDETNAENKRQKKSYHERQAEDVAAWKQQNIKAPQIHTKSPHEQEVKEKVEKKKPAIKMLNIEMKARLERLDLNQLGVLQDILTEKRHHQCKITYNQVENILVYELGGKIVEIGNGSSHKRILLDKLIIIVDDIKLTKALESETALDEILESNSQVKGGEFRQHGGQHTERYLAPCNLVLIAKTLDKAGITLEIVNQLIAAKIAEKAATKANMM